LSAYLKMAPHRMGGAGKGARLAESNASLGIAASSEGQPPNDSDDEAIDRSCLSETDEQDVEDMSSKTQN